MSLGPSLTGYRSSKAATKAGSIEMCQDALDGGFSGLCDLQELSEPALQAVQACNIILQALSFPGMPRQAFNEELLESIVEHVKFDLNTNIYPFHSKAHCHTVRPDLWQG